MYRVVKTLGLALALGLPAHAWAGETVNVPIGTKWFACRFHKAAHDYILPEKVQMAHLPNGKWLALDTMTYRIHHTADHARVTTDDPKRITFGWKFTNMTSNINHFAPLIAMRLTLVKGSRDATLSMRPEGYRSEIAFGSCDTPQVIH
ncbi:hypothetical protein SAMN05216224_105221 [Thioclava dalianensis]|uniref:hypothetical protein n=1 Tax=Thioclava dalianensis TaxID=1185766 RepID=UPI0008F669E0|nr:hypothetical protein [Thioclava dalianensis]SFN43889.1 hypothetical protein SAMN05216224_105221 [Thioclava dalianensis]